MRTRVKICGITNLEDAQAALDYGVHALGFNLTGGPSRLAPQAVRSIERLLAPFAVLVGVCPKLPAAEIREILRDCHLDLAQLPAESTVDECRLLRQRFRVIKTLAVQPGTTAESLRKAISGLAAAVDGILLDFAPVLPPAGRPWGLPWELVQSLPRDGPPLMVAAGLNADNVGTLLQRFQPYALNVDKELEAPETPGRKDPWLMRRFLRALRREVRRSAS